MLFESPKIDNGKIEISYRKPYDFVHIRLQGLLLLEKTRNKKSTVFISPLDFARGKPFRACHELVEWLDVAPS